MRDDYPKTYFTPQRPQNVSHRDTEKFFQIVLCVSVEFCVSVVSSDG